MLFSLGIRELNLDQTLSNSVVDLAPSHKLTSLVSGPQPSGFISDAHRHPVSGRARRVAKTEGGLE